MGISACLVVVKKCPLTQWLFLGSGAFSSGARWPSAQVLLVLSPPPRVSTALETSGLKYHPPPQSNKLIDWFLAIECLYIYIVIIITYIIIIIAIVYCLLAISSIAMLIGDGKKCTFKKMTDWFFLKVTPPQPPWSGSQCLANAPGRVATAICLTRRAQHPHLEVEDGRQHGEDPTPVRGRDARDKAAEHSLFRHAGEGGGEG